MVRVLPVLVLALAACSQIQIDCRAAQEAAKRELKKAHTAMMEAGAMRMKYPIDIEVLEAKHRLVLEPISYELRIASAGSDAFVIEARGKDAMTGDIWRIDESGAVTSLAQKCP